MQPIGKKPGTKNWLSLCGKCQQIFDLYATTRPDIPLHATVMLESRIPGALETIAQLKQKGYPAAYVGDVMGYWLLAQICHQVGAVVRKPR